MTTRDKVILSACGGDDTLKRIKSRYDWGVLTWYDSKNRHCERSEAIQESADSTSLWIAALGPSKPWRRMGRAAPHNDDEENISRLSFVALA